MEDLGDAQLRRTSSQTSSHHSSSSSRKNSTVRVRPRKHSSIASLKQTTPLSPQKSLTSFPSLSPSPDASPVAPRSKKPDTINTLGVEPESTKYSTVRKIPHSLVETLVASPTATANRAALFDDAPQDARNVPGNLQYSTDEQIQRMVERTGIVPFIRQLANDLAQRDAQVTILRRKAEERERVLRKLLQECEVSNLDIENRLRAADRENDTATMGRGKGKSESDGMYPDDDLDLRMQRAMADKLPQEEDNVNPHADPSAAVAAALAKDSVTAETFARLRELSRTTTGWKAPSKQSSRAQSILSNTEGHTGGGDRPRSNSGMPRTRRALHDDLFTDPQQQVDASSKSLHTIRRQQSQDVGKSATERSSSISVSAWTRLFAGSTRRSKNSDKERNGSITQRPGAVRTPSSESSNSLQKTASSTKAKTRETRSSLGSNTNAKQSVSATAMTSKVLSRAPDNDPSNAGPVELLTIGQKDPPPALNPQHNKDLYSNPEYHMDTFGFMYSKEVNKMQSEAVAALRKQKRSSNVESLGDARDVLEDNIGQYSSTSPDVHHQKQQSSRPGSNHSSLEETTNQRKEWHDHLKATTSRAELLFHTAITSVTAAEAEGSRKASHVTVQKSGSVPALSVNPDPAPSRISSSNAEFAKPISSTTPIDAVAYNLNATQPDLVKTLLEQLKDVHDSSQREKTVKWNEFLRKVRAERNRESEAAITGEGRAKGYTLPEAKVLDGEIGVASLRNQGKVGRAKLDYFRELVLGGIPVVERAKIWLECSGASSLRVPGYYEELVKNGTDDPKIVEQIQVDITRTLTNNIYFRKLDGVQTLREVLLAYSRRNVEVGYCQGMNLIAANLLLILPTAEDAFWVLASLIENILPTHYYDHSLLTSRADQVVLRSYVSELLPKLSSHLDELGIELEALTFQWFLSVFTDCLSAEALFRVWDVVLCMHDGSTFLFQVALALLKLNERALLNCDNPAAIYHYINHQMTNHAISIDGLVRASHALEKVVKRTEVKRRRAKAVEYEKEVMEQREEVRRLSLSKRKQKESIDDTVEDRSRARTQSAALTSVVSRESSQLGSVSTTSRSFADDDMDSLEEVQASPITPMQQELEWGR